MLIKRKWILYIIMSIVIVFLIYSAIILRKDISRIIQPFFIAVIIAYLLNPIVIKMENHKISRPVSIILIYFVFGLILVGVTVFIVPELVDSTKDLMVTLPDITHRYQNMMNNIVSYIESSNWPPDVKAAIFKEIQNGADATQLFVMNTLKRSLLVLVDTLRMMLDFILSMIIAYYFIKDAELFKLKALSLVPRRWRNWVVNVGRDIHGILSNFIQGQLITAVIIAVLEMIGLSIIHLKYALILGIVGGIANIIPYFGPLIGAIPAVGIALIDSPTKVIWTIIVFTIVQQIDGAFVSPKVIEGKLGLHPVTTIVAVLVGGQFFGILGMLVAVPITAVMKVIIKRSIEVIV